MATASIQLVPYSASYIHGIMFAGTVVKLLQRVNRENDIRLDLINVPFPPQSQESVGNHNKF